MGRSQGSLITDRRRVIYIKESLSRISIMGLGLLFMPGILCILLSVEILRKERSVLLESLGLEQAK